MLVLQKQTESGMNDMLGQRIASQRRKLGLNQTELAQRLCISPSTIGMYEQGRREPSNAILVALSKELHVSIDYLLTGHNWTSQGASANTLLVCPNNKIVLHGNNYTVLPMSDDELMSALSLLLQDS